VDELAALLRAYLEELERCDPETFAESAPSAAPAFATPAAPVLFAAPAPAPSVAPAHDPVRPEAPHAAR
jgi:hypothetical protein